MPQVGFEPTTPVFERAKTVHALGRAASVIGRHQYWIQHIYTFAQFSASQTNIFLQGNDDRIKETVTCGRGPKGKPKL
jgi:hypothetical protein